MFPNIDFPSRHPRRRAHAYASSCSASPARRRQPWRWSWVAKCGRWRQQSCSRNRAFPARAPVLRVAKDELSAQDPVHPLLHRPNATRALEEEHLHESLLTGTCQRLPHEHLRVLWPPAWPRRPYTSSCTCTRHQKWPGAPSQMFARMGSNFLPPPPNDAENALFGLEGMIPNSGSFGTRR
jgi:hypothetical protein